MTYPARVEIPDQALVIACPYCHGPSHATMTIRLLDGRSYPDRYLCKRCFPKAK